MCTALLVGLASVVPNLKTSLGLSFPSNPNPSRKDVTTEQSSQQSVAWIFHNVADRINCTGSCRLSRTFSFAVLDNRRPWELPSPP